METHGLELVGPLIMQKVSTLPVWTSDDEGREIYVQDEEKIQNEIRKIAIESLKKSGDLPTNYKE